MRLISLPEHDVTCGEFTDATGEKHPMTGSRTEDGIVLTVELEQADFAKLLNGARIRLRFFGPRVPIFGLKIA